MALRLAPLPSASSSNGPNLAISRCRPFSANHHRPLRFPCPRAAPRLQVDKAPAPAKWAASASSPGEEAETAALPYLHVQQHASSSSPHSHGRSPLLESLEETFRNSPNGAVSSRWREYHGCSNWAGLLEPLDPDLRAEIIKYGDLCQLTYDAFDHEKRDCLHEEHELLERAGLTWAGYTVTMYIYASSDVHMLPKWLENCTSNHGQHESSWIGFIAVATDEKEIARLGRHDIVVVWRGTVTRLEWLENIDGTMIEPLGISNASHAKTVAGHFNVGVERGFHTLYTARNVDAPHGHASACNQVRDEVARLVHLYKGQENQMSITMTGHSLGGALALLAAYDVSLNCIEKDIPISVISFAAPRVGNEAFKVQLEELGVNVLRIVNHNDMVPKVPGIFVHEASATHIPANVISGAGSHGHNLAWNTYVHVGVELLLDNHFSPFLKKSFSIVDTHNLEVYLHLVDGYWSVDVPFVGLVCRDHHQTPSRVGEQEVMYNPHQLEKLRFCMRLMKRDVTLVNKTTSLLLDELHVEAKWQERKLPKPSLRLSPPTISTLFTTNRSSHFAHELLHRLTTATNL
ncbi:hypothetical protein GOP47_0019228 [Adiantum capillus-veneris]|uniref:Fungal lipase-type domain-containing protein n=1 Tax=Adiantum capillus-veneris TaxID=13818 RepID=A0A9D4UER0_ADICA|nr:hypothetical protein GOP47_0019228 [Adiantum capillus-veneris]